MILRHTTLTVNLPSIEKRGIDPRFSKGKIVAVWLHTPDQTRWAEEHVRKRHGLGNGLFSITTLEVDVPNSWLKRRNKGVWTCERVIPPSRILGLVTKEAIGTEEIHQHKERFANCLATLKEAERTQWISALLNEVG
jgi:hypothetical protein